MMMRLNRELLLIKTMRMRMTIMILMLMRLTIRILMLMMIDLAIEDNNSLIGTISSSVKILYTHNYHDFYSVATMTIQSAVRDRDFAVYYAVPLVTITLLVIQIRIHTQTLNHELHQMHLSLDGDYSHLS